MSRVGSPPVWESMIAIFFMRVFVGRVERLTLLFVLQG
jgi:hypothetical protein